MDQLIDDVLLGFGRVNQHGSVVIEDDVAKEDQRQVLSTMDVSRITDQLELNQSSLSGIKLEVLNGYGIKGAASEAADFFRSSGCVIVRIENAASFEYEDTVIVDWNRKVKKALDFSRFIDIDPSRIIVYDNYDKPIDLTIVLGNDWPKLFERLRNNVIN